MISLQSMLHTEQKAKQKNAGHETRSRKFALRIMFDMSPQTRLFNVATLRFVGFC